MFITILYYLIRGDTRGFSLQELVLYTINMFQFSVQPFLCSIRALIEAGLVDQWLREVIAVTPQCLQPPTADRTDGVSPIDLKSFSGPLLVLVAGERRSDGQLL